MRQQRSLFQTPIALVSKRGTRAAALTGSGAAEHGPLVGREDVCREHEMAQTATHVGA